MKDITQKSILQKKKITQNANFVQKMILVLVVLILFNFTVPTSYSQADIGGVLISPIVDLLCSVGDIAINLLQKCMTGDWGSTGATNWSLSAFLMESSDYYAAHTDDPAGEVLDSNIVDPNAGDDKGFDKGWLGMKDEYYIPVATYSPEQIFAGNVAGLDINFINPNNDKFGYDDDGEPLSSAGRLQKTIASWYVALRNLSVVGLLSVLVYVGIRIILSSTAADKAKYKQMFTDWLIALCLLFFLHYIMSFVITLTESICQAIGGNGENTIIVQDEAANRKFSTNLLGLARFKTQYADMGQKVTFLIFYLALVIYTCMFTWTYLKRLLMMAFLTLIAPLVALTYPIDKISDGKAQAFDTWLKEYVFNALLQPFHLIIYMVFVGSAMELAQTNIIYGIAAMGFILPAEKILRNIFGFNKAGAGTVGALTGFTAGSLANKFLKGKGGSGSGKSGGKAAPEGEKPPRFEKKHDVNDIDGGDAQEDNANRLRENSGGPSAADANAVDDGEDPVERMRREALEEQIADGQLSENELSNDQKRLLGINNNSTENSNFGEQDNKDEEEKAKNSKFKNWTRAHNINGRSIGRGAWKGIKGVAKFGTRTAFKAGAGTLAAAVTAASGGGIAGAIAAGSAGWAVGGRLGDKAVNFGSVVGRGAGRVGKALYADATAANSEEGLKAAYDALLGGTKLGREIDLANGNTRYQDVGARNEWKHDKNNIKYVRDQMAAQNGGIMPSAKEVREEMNSFDPYLAEGLTDIKEIQKARRVAKDYKITDKQSAIIAAIGKEKGITADVLNDSKKATQKQANLRQEFINKGNSETTATKQAEYTMNVLKAQNGVANNLKKIKK